MPYFDMHVHPTLKAGLSDKPSKYNAWTPFPFLATGARYVALKSFKEIVTSQANLTQLKKSGTVSIIALIGLEKAFAGNWAVRKILASPHVSPLSRPLLTKVVHEDLTYYDMFLKDLDVLLKGPRKDEFNIIKKYSEITTDKVNIVLSVEGAHSFQSEKSSAGEQAVNDSIITNFTRWRDDHKYRLHHLTLTHLSRQPACVHCFGVKIMVLGHIDVTRDVDFQPDPTQCGISPLGKEVIKLAYNTDSSRRILIDVKHMSYQSRKEFYKLRADNHWETIPLVASHSGVTGTSFAGASLHDIKNDAQGCRLVSWNRRKGLRDTWFNPWTINLFDGDIEQILLSHGLIGVSLDQRILGYQTKFFGEFMSPREVDELGLPNVQKALVAPKDFEAPLEATLENVRDRTLTKDIGLVEMLMAEDSEAGGSKNKDGENVRGHDLLFDIEEEDDALVLGRPASHIDYLANNILHIIRVGYQYGFDGTAGHADVINHICIGSDLDGIVDSINFPKSGSDQGIDKDNWVTSDEYLDLQPKLKKSLELGIGQDPFLASRRLDVAAIVEKVMHQNGLEFLKKHFI